MTSRADHLTDEILNEWLDATLDDQARAAAGAHLAGCQVCASRLETLQLMFAQLDSLPDLPLERDLSVSVVGALARRSHGAAARQPARARARWLAGLIFAAQAAAAVLLLAFAWPVVAAFAARVPGPFAGPGPSVVIDEVGALLGSLRAFVANPLSMWTALQHGLAAIPADVAAVLPAWLNPLAALLVVAGAAGLWLLGNALVLNPPALARLRRNS